MAGAKPLGDLGAGEFLREYWQRKPLLVRGAFPEFADPLGPEDLAGLAVEAPVESRIVLAEDRGAPFAVRYGPFEPGDFENLPERDWTLLVRHVDKLLPGVAALLDPFRFIPEWRIDDVMVSYAAPGGSVGAHVDRYDVFLIQGRGRRLWQINDDPHLPRESRDDTELDVLKAFSPTREWELGPGDLLYLPPAVAHHGVARSECLTYSVGFRAPGADELLAGWMEHLIRHTPRERHYADPELRAAEQPGKLDRDALERVQKLLTEALTFDEEDFRRWFGTFITTDPGLPDPEPLPRPMSLERLKRQLDAGRHVRRNPMTRVCYVERGGRAWLFVAGSAHDTSLELATRLGNLRRLGYQDLRATLKAPDDAALLIELINQGHWLLEE